MFSTLAFSLTYGQIHSIKPYLYDLYMGYTHWFTYTDSNGDQRLVIWCYDEYGDLKLVFTDGSEVMILETIEEFVNCASKYGTGKMLMSIPELYEQMKSNVFFMFCDGRFQEVF